MRSSTSGSAWPARIPGRLNPDEVHVWRTSLGLAPARLKELESTLSAQDRSCLRHLRLPSVRRQFIVARSVLREILGYCTGADPGDLRFGCNAFGKPFLKGIARQESPCFNLSHSGELLLVAVALGREVGIDLERLRGGLDFRSLAQRFFSKRETSSLLALPADRRKEAFFACWTRKEACVKAFGRGLAFPLEQFDVSVHPDRAAKLLAIRGGQLPHRRWRLADLPAPPGYAAALAAEGGAFRFRQWQWSRCAGTAAG